MNTLEALVLIYSFVASTIAVIYALWHNVDRKELEKTLIDTLNELNVMSFKKGDPIN